MLGEKEATWGPPIGQDIIQEEEMPHMLGEKEQTWGPPLGFEGIEEPTEEPIMLGEKESTWGPSLDIVYEEEKPHMLGEKAATYGPPLGSDEPRIPVILEDEPIMLGEKEETWGPALLSEQSEEKPSPFFFSANPSFHKPETKSHPMVKASAAEPKKNQKKHGFKSFFDSIAEQIKKVEKPATKLINTVVESAKDGDIDKDELAKIEDEIDSLAAEVKKDRKEISKAGDSLADEIASERKNIKSIENRLKDQFKANPEEELVNFDAENQQMLGEDESTWGPSPDESGFNNKKETALKELAEKQKARHAHKSSVLNSESHQSLAANAKKSFKHERTQRLEVLFGLSAVAVAFSCACLYKKKQTQKNNGSSLAAQEGRGSPSYAEIGYSGTEVSNSSDMV